MVLVPTAQDTSLFEDVCKSVFGDFVDPDALRGISKASPDQADVNAGGKPKKQGRTAAENIALATNAGGVVAGPGAVYGAVRAARNNSGGVPRDTLRGLGRIVDNRRAKRGVESKSLPTRIATALDKPKNRKMVAAAAAAGATGVVLQGLNTAGDAIAARHFSSVGDEKKKQKLEPTGVTKADLKIGGSVYPDARKHLKVPGKNGTLVPTSRLSGPSRSISVHNNVKAARQLASTTPGKVAIGGAGLYMGGKIVSGANRRRQGYYVDPNAAYYGKRDDGDAVFEGEFSKFDDDKQLAFGWASIVKKDGMPVVDRQGDYIDIDDLEDAAYAYVHKSRVGGDMHRRNGESPHHVSDMVESIVFTDDKVAKMGLPDDFPRGWWVGFKVHDPETWQLVRKGGRTGFSIHGKGIRKDVPIDDLMGY